MGATLELARRISAEENIDSNEPEFFSISLDHVVAYINVHWLSRNESGAFCFHMRHLLGYFLDVDGLKAVARAVKNILDYGVEKRLAKICEDLDMYAQKIKETVALDKGNSASKDKQQHKKRLRGKDNAKQAQRTKRHLPDDEDDEDEEDEEDEENEQDEEDEEDDREGPISSAAQRLQILQIKIPPKDTNSPLLNVPKRASANEHAKQHGRAKQPEQAPPLPNLRKSARISALHAARRVRSEKNSKLLYKSGTGSDAPPAVLHQKWVFSTAKYFTT